MKKTLIALALLASLVSRNLFADSSATSANCTVNTCDLEVEATPDVQGVKVIWRPQIPECTYVVYRGNVQIFQHKAEPLPAGQIYINGGMLDPSAEYGKEYTYKVVNKDTGESGSAKGMRAGTGTAPEITAVHPAKLWLINDGPYNLKFSLNDYDKNRYTITKIGVTVDGSTCQWYDWSGDAVLNIFNKFKKSEPGEYEIGVRCSYQENQTKNVTTPTKDMKTAKAKVFFHKYGASCSDIGHPWKKYWEKEALRLLGDFKVVNLPSDADGSVLGYCKAGFHHIKEYSISSESDSDKRMIDSLPIARQLADYYVEHYEIDPKACISLTVSQYGISAVGIDAAAYVCSHEKVHLDTAEMLAKVKGRYRYCPVSLTDAQMNWVRQNLSADHPYRKVVEDSLVDKAEWYYDEDKDEILDKTEAGLGISSKTKFTHGTDYYHQDSEYIAFTGMTAKNANHKKDFAFPGSQIANAYEGYSPRDWAKVMKDLSYSLKIDYGAAGKALRAARPMMVSRGTVENDVSDDYAVLDVLPEFDASAATGEIAIVEVGKGAGVAHSGALYSGLAFGLKLHSSLSDETDVAVSGCLVDENNSPIVSILKLLKVAANGDTDCQLIFPSAYIYGAKRNGFALKCLKVTTIRQREEILFAGIENPAETDRRYSYSEFVPNDGYLDEKSIAVDACDEGIRISVAAEIVSNGTYEICADLVDTNGEHVATARLEDITGAGTKTQTLVVPKKDIFLSKLDGPYTLFKIELLRDGESIDSKWHGGMSEPYSYLEFATGDETIIADAESFAVDPETVGVDGLCDALNFSFDVANLAPSNNEWRAKLYLKGTNDELVCSSSSLVVLSNRMNHVRIPFFGADIIAKGVEGPYYASEVTIEEVESGTVVERFAPRQILIDRRLDEFGDTAVALDGKATLGEGTAETPFVVEVPVRAMRPGNVAVSAILMSTNGTPVCAAQTQTEFAEAGSTVLVLRFPADEINRSGVRGPYAVGYMAVKSDHLGTEEIHVDDLGLGVLERSTIIYVDSAAENDDADGLTPQTAKLTLRGAVGIAQPYDTILVNDGVYEPFACDVIGVKVRSVNGPEKTIIDGEGQLPCAEFFLDMPRHYDEETDDWYRDEPQPQDWQVIEGFTLRNGWSEWDASGIYGGIAKRCIITGCKSDSSCGAAEDCELHDCIICGNEAHEIGGAGWCQLYNCTVTDNRAERFAGVRECQVFNSIVWGNLASDGSVQNFDVEDVEWGSTFEYSCTYPLPEFGEGNIDADPGLVAPSVGDVRLRSSSPCVDAASDMFVDSDVDVYGNARVQGDAPEMGAVENMLDDRIAVIARVKGAGWVTPNYALVVPGGSATFSAGSTWQEFKAFERNGAVVSENSEITLEKLEADTVLTAVFLGGRHYVSATGSNANDGRTWARAKASIQSALDDAEDGDVIYVGAGTYKPFDSNDKKVEIRSVAGAMQTIIDADHAGACAFMGWDPSETNTSLVGFTLMNGRVSGAGGGVRGGTLVDCRIINNQAGECGGGLYCSIANRCVISNNVVRTGPNPYEVCGGGAYGSWLANCLVAGNRLEVLDIQDEWMIYGGGAGTYGCRLNNCSVVDNAVLLDEDVSDENFSVAGSVGGSAYNTIFWGNTVNGECEEGGEGARRMSAEGCLDGVNPLFVDGSYRLSESSPCIDAGLDDYVVGGLDLAGHHRVSGAAVDIGAYEFSQDDEDVHYYVSFNANGGYGEMAEQEFTFGIRQPLSGNEFERPGRSFAGWSYSSDEQVVFKDGESVINLSDEQDGRVELFAKWQPLGVSFASTALAVDEGRALILSVLGGRADIPSSVQVQVTYNTAAAADLDLKNAMVNGVMPKSFKFPVTLEWAKGEIGEKTVEIPVLVDKVVEADEFLTLQLLNPMNMEIGEASACTVTIRDPQFGALKSAVESGTATKAQSNDLQKIEKAFVGKSYVRALANDLTRGKVTGSALAVDGKNVSLKATANKGWVFAGWYTDPACTAGHELTGCGDYRNPSLAYPNINGAVTVYARFIMPEEDDLELGEDFLPAEFAVNEAVSISVPVESVSYPTVTVSGLPPGLKYYAKETLVKATKTTGAYTIPANTIYGTPTKATTKPAAVTVTVKNLGGYQIVRKYEVSVVATAPSTAKAKVVSDALQYYSVAIDPSDDFAGKVTGAGVYQAGKKVTLKATANKGYVFNGWYTVPAAPSLRGADQPTPADAAQRGAAGTVLVSQTASYSFGMPTEDVAYAAKFVTAEEDAASIGTTVANFAFGAAAESGGSTGNATNVMCGVYLEWPVAASALSEPTVAVSGLPAGLKFTAKPVTSKVGSGKTAVTVTNVPPNTIYGAPSAASKTDKYGNVTPSKVKVTVTTAGKSKEEYVIDLTVDPLPAWAQGEFSGLASTPDGRLGSASMSVTAAGKVTGKVIVNGTNVSFAAANYDISSKTVGETNLVAAVTGKLGKDAVTGGITVVTSGASGTFAGAEMTLHRNVWKDKGAEFVPEEYQGTYSVKLGAGDRGTGYLSLTVDKKGAVKVAGKAPDGTALSGAATLTPNGDGAYFADVFAAPSAYKGGYVAGHLSWDADGKVSSDGLNWTSFNPQSTGDYEKGGFDRALDCSGAKYDKTASLKDGYDTLRLSALGVGEELFITVDQTGKKFVVVDKGDAKLTFTFTQTTGIWQGTYLIWPDPSSTKSVKVSFEGILVSGEEDLKGFGTYDATSSYPVYNKKGEQTGKKSYKYKESVPVSFDRE